MNWMKKFFKDMKRIRWVRGKKMVNIMWTTLLFVAISGLILWGIELGFNDFWNVLGIGL